MRRRKAPGGAAGLQNQSGGRKVPGGFDSLPLPPAIAEILCPDHQTARLRCRETGRREPAQRNHGNGVCKDFVCRQGGRVPSP